MKIRLGILGADDSTEIIQSVVKDYPEFECLPVVYWVEGEIIELLKPRLHEVDMWVFSGQVPYSIAEEWGQIDKPMFYVPHLGASLYKTLLHVVYQHQLKIGELSFDTFHPEELDRVLEEAELEVKSAFLKYYPGEIDATELAEYHYNLWREGKTKAAITCLRTAHLKLQRLGVPVFRVLPTRSAVETILNMALRTREMLHFMDSQIAVQMVEFDSFVGFAKDTFSTDKIHQMELRIEEELLRYAKKVQGSFKSAGPGRYVIFTTRGLLRDITQNFSIIPDLGEKYLNKDAVTCGIGIGQTAYEAEIHAGSALLHAREFGKGSWMVFFDDKTVVGPLGKQEQITYSYAAEQFKPLSELTSLSVSTLSKLASILGKIGKKEINALELAQYMQIMPRSARRILAELEDKGIALIVGEENPHPRGRPRKIYRITF